MTSLLRTFFSGIILVMMGSVMAQSGWVWQNPTPSAEMLESIDFINANTSWAVGRVGTILHTTDGGATWISLMNGITINLYTVDFIDASTGWVVGNGGTILQTTIGGTVVGIEDEPPVWQDLPNTFELGQNYPNPFNGSTLITLTLPVSETVTLQIYNILGERMCTLHNGVLAAGEHRFSWDGRDEVGQAVNSGIFIYQVKADNFARAKKMILLK
ncbi:MAG: hypothetical protein CV087_21645 [Candidatus Brocadia sp. WS118]|nr:MAG: hypothetical protein CV087_21645 [Candidatus Brocadia sp. WS118]